MIRKCIRMAPPTMAQFEAYTRLVLEKEFFARDQMTVLPKPQYYFYTKESGDIDIVKFSDDGVTFPNKQDNSGVMFRPVFYMNTSAKSIVSEGEVWQLCRLLQASSPNGASYCVLATIDSRQDGALLQGVAMGDVFFSSFAICAGVDNDTLRRLCGARFSRET